MNNNVVFKNLIIITLICVFCFTNCFGQSLSVTYNTPNKFTVNTAITSLSPTVTGGTATAFSINPSLSPTGLIFNTSTGIITGTPTKVSDGDYNISASNATGPSKPFSIKITINPAVPGIAYTPSNRYTVGIPITELDPTTYGGTATKYTISPALPAGLIFNTVTGTITGTPTVASAADDYTVIATNETGSSSPSKVKIIVNPAPASDHWVVHLSLIGIFLICSGILGFLLYIIYKLKNDKKEALGLPSGSVRAIIAILFVVFFMLLAVVFYFDSDTTVHNTDLSKQIITILGTLVTAVSSFYFGSKTTEQAHANAAAAIQNMLQCQGVQQGQQVKIAVSLDPSVPAAVATAATGAALNNATVQIVQSGTATTTKGNHISTDPDGVFTFTGVAAGSYTLSGSLQVTPAGVTAPVTLTGTQTVSIQIGIATITLTIK